MLVLSVVLKRFKVWFHFIQVDKNKEKCNTCAKTKTPIKYKSKVLGLNCNFIFQIVAKNLVSKEVLL